MEQRGRVLEHADCIVSSRREWTLRDLLTIFRRRKWIVIGCEIVLLAVATLYCVVATRRYVATGQIEIRKEDAGTLGLNRDVTGADAGANGDALDTSMTLETEARVLRSDTLALTVVKDLKLETTQDYFPARKTGFHVPEWVFFWRKPVEPLTVPLDAAPNRRYVVLKIFANHLKVTPVTGTRLIDVSYSSPDPQLAAQVVNRLIAALDEYTFQSRFKATSQASTWLTGQLAGLKSQTEQLQQAADKLEQGTGIYGADASQNVVLTRLQQLNTALTTAESNRIQRQAVWQVVKSGNPELISGLAGNASTGSSSTMSNSLTLLQGLRIQQAQVLAEIDEDDARYGSAYPKMAELHGELTGVDAAIQEEIKRIRARAQTDYEIAQHAEDAAQASFDSEKQIAQASNDRTVAYELARQEADGSRSLYQDLLGKLKEAGVLEGLRSTNLIVVSAAMVPPPAHPHSPNIPACGAMALAGGLFLGCAGALVREATDGTVRSVEELEHALGVSLAGVVPEAGRARWFGRRREDRALLNGAAEVRRAFALPLWQAGSQTLLITSATPGEGKSRLAASLAISLARTGAKVLLVDSDLASPSLHRLFGAEQSSGLSEALQSGDMLEANACAQVPGMSLVWAGGTSVENGADLLASRRMDALIEHWRGQFDFVILDSPPVLPVPDAASLARLCDRTLLVVRHGSTTVKAAQRSFRMIERNLSERGALEVVMNGVPEKSPDYVAYYGNKGMAYDA